LIEVLRVRSCLKGNKQAKKGTRHLALFEEASGSISFPGQALCIFLVF